MGKIIELKKQQELKVTYKITIKDDCSEHSSVFYDEDLKQYIVTLCTYSFDRITILKNQAMHKLNTRLIEAL